MAKSKKKRRDNSVKVDFAGIEATSRSVKDGNYSATIVEVEQKESDNGEYLKFKWEVTPKKGPKATVYDNVSLQPQALWRLRLLLETLGEEVPDGVMEFDPQDLIGREAQIEIVNEKYDGRNQPRIAGFVTDGEESEEEESDEGEDEDEEEEKSSKSSKKSSKNSKKDSDDDEEEEEEESDEEEEEESEDDGDDDDDDKKSSKKSSKIKVGTKVWFKDEDKKKIKGVVTSIDGDTAMVEDGYKEEWEVEVSELNV